MTKKELSLKNMMSLEKAAEHLQEFVSSMKIGKVFVQKNGDVVELTPKPNVFVEVKAKQKKDREKFSISVSWMNEEAAHDDADFTISSTEPEGDSGEEDGEQAKGSKDVGQSETSV